MSSLWLIAQMALFANPFNYQKISKGHAPKGYSNQQSVCQEHGLAVNTPSVIWPHSTSEDIQF